MNFKLIITFSYILFSITFINAQISIKTNTEKKLVINDFEDADLNDIQSKSSNIRQSTTLSYLPKSNRDLDKRKEEQELNSFEEAIKQSFKTDVETKKSFIYKKMEGKELEIYAFFPIEQSKKMSSVIYVHGGSWKGGNPKSSLKWCRYLAEQGVVAFSIEYRLSNKNPYKCIEDVKSAVRWVRKNATQFNIDPNRIALSGNSAGGHLATATATIDGFNSSNDDLSISCKPQLLLLVSPVIDNSPNGFGYERIKDYWKDFSPVHNLNNQLPPTCILLGDKDPLIPLESILKVANAVKKSNSNIELYVFKGKGHGLFNQKKNELSEPIIQTYYYWHKFLAQQGYINKPKKLKDNYKTLATKYKI